MFPWTFINHMMHVIYNKFRKAHSSVLQKKMYLLYLTTPRLVSLLGMLDKSSPTCTVVKEFVEEECPEL